MPRIKFQKVTLSVVFYREGNNFIAFSPALDLSTCGDTQEQAKKRFEDLTSIFFDEVYRMGTLEDVLQECGWTMVLHPQRCWQPPVFVGQSQKEFRIPCPA